MSAWSLAEAVVALLLLASGGVVLIAALGLLRLPDFFLRMHAPALASTLAAWLVTFASIVHFSSRGQGIALHAWLIIIVLSVLIVPRVLKRMSDAKQAREAAAA